MWIRVYKRRRPREAGREKAKQLSAEPNGGNYREKAAGYRKEYETCLCGVKGKGGRPKVSQEKTCQGKETLYNTLESAGVVPRTK